MFNPALLSFLEVGQSRGREGGQLKWYQGADFDCGKNIARCVNVDENDGFPMLSSVFEAQTARNLLENVG